MERSEAKRARFGMKAYKIEVKKRGILSIQMELCQGLRLMVLHVKLLNLAFIFFDDILPTQLLCSGHCQFFMNQQHRL